MATLVAIPFVITSGPFADDAGFRKLLWAYCWLLAGLSVWCLGVASVHFIQTGNDQVFFYHNLTAVLGVNAVYFSAYILMAVIFLFSGAVPAGGKWIFLSCFFAGLMVLLASRLLLVVLVVTAVSYLWRRRSFLSARRLFGLSLLVATGMVLLASTDNPVSRRYKAILPAAQTTGSSFNGLTLRLRIWRSAERILDRRHAWVVGVSAGDSQDLLNQCFLDSRMSIGYLDYNFHNQYIQVLVDDGLLGLGVFMAALVGLGLAAGRTMEGRLVLLTVLTLGATASIFEMQHSVFLSCFFVVLPWECRNSGIMRNLRYSKSDRYGIRDKYIRRGRARKGFRGSHGELPADAGDARGGAAGR
jgi:O-antigen ligase